MIQKATLLAALGLVIASVAFAGVPSPTNSTWSTRINLVGYNAAASDPTNAADSVSGNAKFTITVRDLATNVIAGSNVVLDFSAGNTDYQVAGTQSYHAEVVTCGSNQVSNYTNVAGVATFVVVGGNRPTGAVHVATAGKVYADGVLLGTFGIGVYDRDGSNGVKLADLGYFAGDYFSAGHNQDRSDYDGNGSVVLADLGLFAGAYFGASKNSYGTYCP